MPPETLNLDIVGFSRGAAEARVFANLVDRFLAGDDEFMVVNGVTRNAVADFTSASAQRARDYLNGCTAPTVNLRFLGLWDTVSHLGTRQDNDARESYGDSGDIYLGIPDSVGYTAQAVAANERREAFSAWSIFDRPGQSAGNKTEKRFLGAHSDIGGGYPDSDLSDVAFMWMVQQAEEGGGLPDGVIDRGYISDKGFDVVVKPTANDPVFDAPDWVPDNLYGPGRRFRYLDAGGATDIEQDAVTTGTDRDGNEVLGSEQAIGLLEQDIYQDEVREVWRPSGLRRENVNDGFDDTGLQQVGMDGRNADGTVNERYAYEAWLERHYGLDVEIDQAEGEGKRSTNRICWRMMSSVTLKAHGFTGVFDDVDVAGPRPPFRLFVSRLSHRPEPERLRQGAAIEPRGAAGLGAGAARAGGCRAAAPPPGAVRGRGGGSMMRPGSELQVYLGREAVDLRKSIDGLSVLVQEAMALDPFEAAVFVFCNRARDKVKILAWERNGFVLWYKRLESERFKWPERLGDTPLQLTGEQLNWLLDGYNIELMRPHKALNYQAVG